jgi:hypothetical protein
MGQPITVVEKHAPRPGVVRFELNRNLTGMGHERYLPGDRIDGVRPVDEMARRLFAHGGIDGIHVYSNIVTCDLAKGAETTGLAELMRELFVHYVPGVVPPTDEELLAQAPTG